MPDISKERDSVSQADVETVRFNDTTTESLNSQIAQGAVDTENDAFNPTACDPESGYLGIDSHQIPREFTHQTFQPVDWSRLRKVGLLLRDTQFVFPVWLVDQLFIQLALVCSWLLLKWYSLTSSISLLPLTAATVVVGTLVFRAAKLYPGIGLHPVHELRKVVLSVSLTFVLVAIMLSFSGAGTFMLLGALAASTCLGVVVVPVARNFARALLAKTKWWAQPVFVFAEDEIEAAKLVDYLRKEKDVGWNPVAVVSSCFDSERSDALCAGLPVISESAVAVHAAQSNTFWGLIVGNCVPGESDEQLVSRHYHSLPRMLHLNTRSPFPSLWTCEAHCSEMPGRAYQNNLRMLFPVTAKRAIDIVVSGMLLILLSPVFAVISCLVAISTRGSVFYAQQRPGFEGRRFPIWKFRSMVPNAEEVLNQHLEQHPEICAEWNKNHKLSYDPRVTSIGRLIRRTSLDELPQLWNVFVGQMSLVGPRPIQNDEVTKYGDVYPTYIQVRPGITGLWQINGRNNTAYSLRLHYVKYYVRNWSLWLDCYVLLRTVRVVLLCEGAC